MIVGTRNCILDSIALVGVVGFNAIITQGKPPQNLNKERCSICRKQFLKLQHDERLLFFCGSCITELHADLISKS